LKAVTFGDGKLITKNDGSGLYGDPDDPDADPHWQEGREQQYPYLYKADETLTIRKAKWLLPGVSLEGPFYVSGEGTEDYSFGTSEEIPAESQITEDGTEVWIENIETDAGAFPEEVKNFDHEFQVQWKIRIEGHTEPWDAGTCSNPIYVCLLGTRQGKNPSWEVVDGACREEDDSSAELMAQRLLTGNTLEASALSPNVAAFKRTWEDKFANGNYTMDTNNNQKLYYYKPGEPTQKQVSSGKYLTSPTPPGGKTAYTGDCLAWVKFLVLQTQLNDKEYKVIDVTPIEGYQIFLVNAWKDIRTDSKTPLFFHNEVMGQVPNPAVASITLEICVKEIIGEKLKIDFGGVRNHLNGIHGQNSDGVAYGRQCHCPSQKVFTDHYLLYIPELKKYFDPSYGVTYDGEFGVDDRGEKAFSENLFALGKSSRFEYTGQPVTTQVFYELDKSIPKPWVKFKEVKIQSLGP